MTAIYQAKVTHTHTSKKHGLALKMKIFQSRSIHGQVHCRRYQFAQICFFFAPYIWWSTKWAHSKFEWPGLNDCLDKIAPHFEFFAHNLLHMLSRLHIPSMVVLISHSRILVWSFDRFCSQKWYFDWQRIDQTPERKNTPSLNIFKCTLCAVTESALILLNDSISALHTHSNIKKLVEK